MKRKFVVRHEAKRSAVGLFERNATPLRCVADYER